MKAIGYTPDNDELDTIAGGSCVLYIDRQYIHEVTSPQAFEGLHSRGAKVFRPAQVTASPDHNIPTQNQHLPVQDLQSARQLSMLENNCTEHGITIFKVGTPKNGIIHVVGPETGLTQPGMTIVCGDSHTSTHGAMGCVAFGIGTSEVEMVLASQCVLQSKPKTMRINVEGQLNPGVCSKDIILYLISKLGTGGGTGHFIEFAGSAIRSLSMEEAMEEQKRNPAAGLSESEQVQVRRQKLADLQAAGHAGRNDLCLPERQGICAPRNRMGQIRHTMEAAIQ